MVVLLDSALSSRTGLDVGMTSMANERVQAPGFYVEIQVWESPSPILCVVGCVVCGGGDVNVGMPTLRAAYNRYPRVSEVPVIRHSY